MFLQECIGILRMRAKICNFPSCNKLIKQDERYCESHIKPKVKPFENAVRHNEGLYNTTRWRKLRKEVLSETPYCAKCGISKNLEIHHIVPPRGNEGLFFDENNCVPVCKSCHRIITAREIKIVYKINSM